MRKFIALLSLVMLITVGFSNYAFAQENAVEDTIVVAQEVAGDSTTVAEEIVEDVAEIAAEPEKPQSFHQVLKEKFIEGGPGFMGIGSLGTYLWIGH